MGANGTEMSYKKNSRNLRIVQLEILEIPGKKIKWIGKSQYIILLANYKLY